MKKLVVIILSFLYLTSTTGARIYMHYCMGEFQSEGFWHTERNTTKCTNCGMEKKKGCCEDKEIFLKVDKKHKQTRFNYTRLKYSPINSRQLFFDEHISLAEASITFTQVPGATANMGWPPPLYVRNCVYRI